MSTTMSETVAAPDTLPGLSLEIPGVGVVSTISLLNKLLNDGYRFTAERIVNNERVDVKAVQSLLRENVCCVVIGMPHESRFADVFVNTIKRKRG